MIHTHQQSSGTTRLLL